MHFYTVRRRKKPSPLRQWFYIGGLKWLDIRQNLIVFERDFPSVTCRLNVSPSIKPLIFLSHPINPLRETDSAGLCQKKKLCQRKLVIGFGSRGWRIRPPSPTQ